MRLRQKLSVLLVAFALSVAAPQAQAQSLTDTLIAAYRNSNLLEQNRAVLRAADEDVAIAVAALRPVVNFIARTQAQFFPGANLGQPESSLSASLSLSAELLIYDFGRSQLRIDVAGEQVLAVRAGLLNVEQQVLLQAVSAFLEVRTALQTVQLREANVRLIERELNAAQQRFEVGEITRTDISIAEARLAGARSTLATAQGDLAIARENFRVAVGDYPGQLATPPRVPQLPRSLGAANDIARIRHPSVVQAQHEVLVADMNVQIAALARQGSVSGTASTTLSRRQDSLRGLPSTTGGQDSVTLGLSYARPLYQGGQLSASHRKAIAFRDASRANLHQTVATVLQNLGRAWANLDVAIARIDASERQIAAAESAYRGVSEEARLGARTTLDVLNAEQELLDARTSLIVAEASRQQAAYSVLQAMGLMTVEHLNLGIPTYDPEAYLNAVRNAPVTSPQGEALDRVLRSISRP